MLILIAACGDGHREPVLDKARRLSITSSAPSSVELPAVSSVELRLTATADSVAVENGAAPFHVLKRSTQITQYPCGSCHDGMSTPAPIARQPEERKSHWDIALDHASSAQMTCATCHQLEDMNHLRRPDGSNVPFDHAYETCRTCHFQQYNDWRGGAHGKQHKTWQGPRVRLNCTSCHNPHSPAFAKRWPVAHPTIPEIRP